MSIYNIYFIYTKQKINVYFPIKQARKSSHQLALDFSFARKNASGVLSNATTPFFR